MLEDKKRESLLQNDNRNTRQNEQEYKDKKST
jgi:hypothetical protein